MCQPVDLPFGWMTFSNSAVAWMIVGGVMVGARTCNENIAASDKRILPHTSEV